MAQLKPLPLLLGALALGALAFSQKKPGDLVTGKSGKTWRVVLLGNQNGTKTYELIAPAGSFGPHEDLSVLRYSQTGSDTSSRQVVGVGQGVPAVMVTTAGSDFGVPIDASRLPG